MPGDEVEAAPVLIGEREQAQVGRWKIQSLLRLELDPLGPVRRTRTIAPTSSRRSIKPLSLPSSMVNLSRGGAMIRCGFAPRLWDIVELQLGEGSGLHGAVRWIKGDSIGLEFAHETRIECDREQRAELLLAVIQRSFPDEVRLEEPHPEEGREKVEEDRQSR